MLTTGIFFSFFKDNSCIRTMFCIANVHKEYNNILPKSLKILFKLFYLSDVGCEPTTFIEVENDVAWNN